MRLPADHRKVRNEPECDADRRPKAGFLSTDTIIRAAGRMYRRYRPAAFSLGVKCVYIRRANVASLSSLHSDESPSATAAGGFTR